MTEPGRVQWDRARAQGLPRFLFWNGVVARGIPMAIVTLLLLQVLQGDLTPDALRSSEFLQRMGLALLVFGAGGALSAFARWKSLESRFGEPSR